MMIFYTYDYQTKECIGEIEISNPKQYDPRIPGNATTIKPPVTEIGQVAKFNGNGWNVVDIPSEIVPEPPQLTREEQINFVIRPIRDQKIRVLQDRIDRYNNQLAGGLITTDTPETMGHIYQIMQQLRDFPATVIDPWNPVWPDENL
jgi:hypothetical protein